MLENMISRPPFATLFQPSPHQHFFSHSRFSINVSSTSAIKESLALGSSSINFIKTHQHFRQTLLS
jgi:hypothetical protein